MGSRGGRQRKPRRRLPPVPPYVTRPTGAVRWTWRLGGPMTRRHEAEARREQAQRRRGLVGRTVLRILGARRHDGEGAARRAPGA